MHDTIRYRVPGFLAALVLASGCAGGSSTADPAADSATPLFVELTVVNDYSRYQDLGVNTEANTGEIINLVNHYFASSSDFTRYTPQIVLVGQRTITSAAEDPVKGVEVDTNGEMNFADALSRFAGYRSARELAAVRERCSHPPHASQGSGATITLAYTWQMCSPVASVAVVQTAYSLPFDESPIRPRPGPPSRDVPRPAGDAFERISGLQGAGSRGTRRHVREPHHGGLVGPERGQRTVLPVLGRGPERLRGQSDGGPELPDDRRARGCDRHRGGTEAGSGGALPRGGGENRPPLRRGEFVVLDVMLALHYMTESTTNTGPASMPLS